MCTELVGCSNAVVHYMCTAARRNVELSCHAQVLQGHAEVHQAHLIVNPLVDSGAECLLMLRKSPVGRTPSGMRMALRRSQANWALLLIVSLPPFCTGYLLSYFCSESKGTEGVCKLYIHVPLLCINILWFLHVDLTFYVVSVIQDSTWLIDPYWTLAPLMLVLFWATHPSALLWTPRQMISLLLLLTWSARLTHSYFRREGWVAGAREDWRYRDMKNRFGRWWTVVQVFAVYAVQHCMLVGLTLPWMPIFFSSSDWNEFDLCATVLCVFGLAIAAHADNTLHAFVTMRTKQDIAVLRQGFWAISRHPNHLGEQMWWWGVALFGIAAGNLWTVVGTFFNTLCMCQIMVMVEARICSTVVRSKEYKKYQQEIKDFSTSLFIALFCIRSVVILPCPQ